MTHRLTEAEVRDHLARATTEAERALAFDNLRLRDIIRSNRAKHDALVACVAETERPSSRDGVADSLDAIFGGDDAKLAVLLNRLRRS